ncbi:MAG TPA: aromatic-ring-hydroxylating dioxygenase subunit beta [Vicinamibacterales bacterium]|nr:aromatic-ring-hydroxylating dioxygenase subunit beta [Vicinamibacterales bacterium]
MTALDRAAVEAFLFREARLLDEGQFDEWLALFTPDCRYWLPIVQEGGDLEPSIIDDDRVRLEERIFRLQETRAYAQEPPSRTQHNISNVEVTEAGAAAVRVLCNLTLFEVRIGDASQLDLGRPQVLAGRCEYLLVAAPETRIALKKVLLLTRDLPLGNLSFII